MTVWRLQWRWEGQTNPLLSCHIITWHNRKCVHTYTKYSLTPETMLYELAVLQLAESSQNVVLLDNDFLKRFKNKVIDRFYLGKSNYSLVNFLIILIIVLRALQLVIIITSLIRQYIYMCQLNSKMLVNIINIWNSNIFLL